MKTDSLIKSLNIAKAALGGTDAALPILSHFCFDDVIWAYNDVVGIVVEEPIGKLKCALHGDTLLGLLQAGAAEDFTIDHSKGTARLKMKRGWAELPAMDVADSPFQIPDEDPIVTLPLAAGIRTGIERCLVSMGEDSIKPEFSGVTVAVKPGLVFYSTDNKTASRYVVPKFVTRKGTACTLPAQACSLLLKLAGDEPPKEWRMDLGSTAAVVQMGSTTMVSRLLPAAVDVFEGTFKQHADNVAFTDVPDGLAQEVAKALVLTARDPVPECTLTFTAKPSVARLTVTGGLGQMDVAIPCGAKVTAQVVCDPRHLARILPMVKQWGVNHARSLVFTDGAFTHVVSSRAGSVNPPTGERTKVVTQSGKQHVPLRHAADEVDDDIPY